MKISNRAARRIRKHHLTPISVLIVTLLATALAVWSSLVSTRARNQARFDNKVQATSDRIDRRLEVYITLLRATAGQFASQHEVTAHEFSEYVRLLELPKNYPGVQGLGFVVHFTRSELPEIERWAREERSDPQFRVWPLTDAEELTSIVFLEPLDRRNQAAIGFDMHSDPIRREAMERSRDTGLPALTGKVTLKQEIGPGKQSGFLLYQAVYRGGRIPETPAQRRSELVGYVYAPFRAEDLMNGIFGTEITPTIGFRIYDGSTVREEALLYSSHPLESGPPRFSKEATISVAGHSWTLTFWSLPAFEELGGSGPALPVGLAGLSVALALFLMSRAQAKARLTAESSADALRSALEVRATAEARLQQADRRKDEFLAMLAHELRNPLAPMLTALHLLDRKQHDGQDAAHEREVLGRQLNHLQRLVDELLDVSRVTQGKVQVRKSPLELVAACERAVEAVRPFAESRSQTLEAELAAEPIWIEADSVRIEQVANNLLRNAVKYSPPGARITLMLEREGGEAVLRVADTGEGISSESLPRLFEPFMQVDRSLERSQGGLGLGLTLVKRLVELHGGTIEAASDGLGMGSVFTVRLPALERSPMPAEPVAAAAPVAGEPLARRVLVVDDNRDAAELMAEVLTLDGHQIELAYEGQRALAIAASLLPQVVFLDIGLPGLDGYEVARRIRRLRGGEKVTLVAITGYGQPSDRQRSAEAGFDAHLVKPVSVEQLRAAVVWNGRRGSDGRPVEGMMDEPPGASWL